MTQQESPYIAQCSFCREGLLRFMRCRQCDAVVAICDQCELIWRNIAAVHTNTRCPSSGSFPACPVCGTVDAGWSRLNRHNVIEASLSQYIAGESV